MISGVNNMKKYKVTQKFMDALEKWKGSRSSHFSRKYNYVTSRELLEIGRTVHQWWHGNIDDSIETNNRLIAIIQWLNGEDVFEVEQPHKFVVRTIDYTEYGYKSYFRLYSGDGLELVDHSYNLKYARKFNTREEAEKYCVPGYEVIEIDSDGNEVE